MRKLEPKEDTVELEILRGYIDKDKKLFWFMNVFYFSMLELKKDNKGKRLMKI
jgi:hypothetical protein